MRTGSCKWCGSPFSKSTTNGARMTSCSEECRRLLIASSNRVWACPVRVLTLVCAECGQTFYAGRARLCCSTVCGKERHARMAGNRDRTCRGCGIAFPSFHLATYCATCRAKTKRDASKNSKHVRRARMRDGLHEHVKATRVYDRDHWTCGICQQPVDQALAYPHPGSPSLDHIVPLARGGAHTYANTQLAHLECNLLKRDALPAALAMA